MEVICPVCKSSNVREVAPGEFVCLNRPQVDLVPAHVTGAGEVPIYRDCFTSFSLPSRKSGTPLPCAFCGRDSLGTCQVCRRRACGLCAEGAPFTCHGCRDEQRRVLRERQRAAAEEETASVRAAAEERFWPAADRFAHLTTREAILSTFPELQRLFLATGLPGRIDEAIPEQLEAAWQTARSDHPFEFIREVVQVEFRSRVAGSSMTELTRQPVWGDDRAWIDAEGVEYALVSGSSLDRSVVAQPIATVLVHAGRKVSGSRARRGSTVAKSTGGRGWFLGAGDQVRVVSSPSDLRPERGIARAAARVFAIFARTPG